MKEYIESITPKTVKVSVSLVTTGMPALIPFDLPEMQAASRAYEKAWGYTPVFTRGGGSIPVVADIANLLNIPVVMMGYGLDSDGLHSPNEHYSIEMFQRGIETAIVYLEELAQIPNDLGDINRSIKKENRNEENLATHHFMYFDDDPGSVHFFGSQPGGDLTSKVWALTELNGQPPVAGTGISAQFTADGNVGGSAGCNRYRGTYTASGNKITFASPLATTMMMCEQAVMDQEAAYLKALGEAKTFAVKGDQLTLTGGDGTDLAVYKAQSQDLAGTSWEVTAYNNGQQAVIGVLEEATLTASFDNEGT